MAALFDLFKKRTKETEKIIQQKNQTEATTENDETINLEADNNADVIEADSSLVKETGDATETKKSADKDVSAEIAELSELSDKLFKEFSDEISPENSDNNTEKNVLHQLVGSLGNTNEEKAGEVGNKPENEASVKKIKRRGSYFVLGIIVLFFSVVGIISTVIYISETTEAIIERRALKQEFTKFLYPVVIIDPPEFESTESLQLSTVITSSIWKIILFGDTNNYEKDMGMMTIPAIDVEASAASIFGNSYDISHRSIDAVEYLFDYIAETNSYIVPEKPHNSFYVPRITEITNEGEVFKVTVEYTISNPLAAIGLETTEEDALKTLVYTVFRSKGIMTIHSIVFEFNDVASIY